MGHHHHGTSIVPSFRECSSTKDCTEHGAGCRGVVHPLIPPAGGLARPLTLGNLELSATHGTLDSGGLGLGQTFLQLQGTQCEALRRLCWTQGARITAVQSRLVCLRWVDVG